LKSSPSKEDDYRGEHIIYESQPGFYVTSSLYIPEIQSRKKAPKYFMAGESDYVIPYLLMIFIHIISLDYSEP